MLQLPNTNLFGKQDAIGLVRHIAKTINESLQPLDIAAELSLNDSCLTVNLVSRQVLDPAKLITIIRMELAILSVESITRVKVYSWRKDEELPELLPAWNKEFMIDPPVKSSKKKQQPETRIIKLPDSSKAETGHVVKPPRNPDVAPPPTTKIHAPSILESKLNSVPPKTHKHQSPQASLVMVGACIVAIGMGLGVSVRLFTAQNPAIKAAESDSSIDRTVDNLPISGNSTNLNRASVKDDATDKVNEARITLPKFNQIKKGMTIKQVEDLVGSPGKLIANSKVGATSGQVYSWKNAEGSNAIIEFKNGEMVAKAQAGL